MTQKTAHFTISGADFTRIARERVLDDNPGSAWRIASCLGNDDNDDRNTGVADAALGILSGTQKLVGDERDMKLVKEHSKVTEKYLKAVNYLYAGRIRFYDKWYQPVAYVSDCGPRDMRNDHGKQVSRLGLGRGYSNRAWHYCGYDEIIIDNANYPDPKCSGVEREVIFRACGERPHWFDVPINPQAALDEFLAAGHFLEERGHSKWYGTTSDEIWADADDGGNDPEKVDVGAKAMSMRGEALAKLDRQLRDEARLAQEIENEDDREAAEEAIEHDRAQLRTRQLQTLRETILKQAGEDLIDLSWPAVLAEDGEIKTPAGSVKIPRAPFMRWAFARMKMFEDQLPPWQNVCPVGMKMPLDDQNHTDWAVGAGFDPLDRDLLYYPGAVAEAAMKLASELQDKFDKPSDVHVLVDGPVVSGTVVHGKRNKPCPAGAIVVLPDLRPIYLITIEDAAGVITEEGGELAHLAQVGRELGLPIVRVANAREKYEEGIEIMINTGSRIVMGL